MIRFGEWLPDLPELENPGALEAKNVFPQTVNSYGPVPDLQTVGNALTARCQGGDSFRAPDKTVFVTAFDATKAYSWDGAAWNDISRTVGGAYACASTDMWSTTQFGANIIAVNGTDTPQLFTIGSSSNYAALGGSPPTGRFCCTIGDFVQIGRIASAANRVKWSSINNVAAWTIGTDQCDEQDLPEGGQIMGMRGGESGLIILETAIYTQTYTGANAGIFQFHRITDQLGCCAENSIATKEQTTFFLAFDGFYSVNPASGVAPIGNQKVNDYFWRRVNRSYLERVKGIISPDDNFYIVAFPSIDSTTGTPDSLMFYNFDLQRWSRAVVTTDYLMRFFSNVGYHTDNIDTVITNTDATAYLTDNNPFFGSGRASLAAFNTSFKLATFQGSNLEAITDTTEAEPSPGERTFVREIWPYADGGTMTVYLGTRNLPTEGITWSSEMAVNSTGFAPFRENARFGRIRVKQAAGGVWSHLQGARMVARSAGRY